MRTDRAAAYAVLVAAVVLAFVFYPFMSRVNSVVSTNESSLLPKNVESVETMNVVEREINSSQEKLIYLVAGVPVNLSTFYRLNGTVTLGVSWLSVAEGAYTDVENESKALLNVSLSASRGLEALWETVLNASAKLSGLGAQASALSSLLREADYAYSRYYSLGANLTALLPRALGQLERYGGVVENLSEAYGVTYFNVLRAEYALYNLTDAYQTGNLTQQDVEEVIGACPAVGVAPPPSPQLVEVLFAYVVRSGGPSAFTPQLANNFTYGVLSYQLNATGVFLALELLGSYSKEFGNLTGRYPVAGLMNNLTVPNQYRLYQIIVKMSNTSGVAVFESLLSSLPLTGQARQLVYEIGLRYAASGFNNSELPSIAVNVTAQALEPYIPWQAAYGIARAAVGNSFNESVAAFLATETVLEELPQQYANYSPLLEGRLPAALLAYDPGASMEIYYNVTLADEAAAYILSQALNVSQDLVMGLLTGRETPYGAALALVNGSLPVRGRALLEVISSEPPIYNYSAFIELLPGMLSRALAALGVPANLTEVLVGPTLRVLSDPSAYPVELTYLTQSLFNATFDTVIGRLRGTLVQNDLKGFAVFVAKNLGYPEALGYQRGLEQSLRQAGYSNASVMMTGTLALDYELSNSSLSSISRSDLISTVLVVIILAIVLEALAAVVVPFIGVGIGLVVSLGVAYLLASHGIVSLNSISRTIMYEVGLGLGIDYASLISRRFREELGRLGDPRRAAWEAVKRSWRAVVTGALTATIGFGSMAIATNFPFLVSLGEAAPISILITMAVSLTVIPALLSVIGGSRALWWPSRPSSGPSAGAPRRSASLMRRSGLALALIAVLLVPAAFAYFTFRGSYDFTLMMPQGAGAVRALHYLSNNYAAGLMYPDYVVAPNVSVLQQVNRTIAGLGCVQSTQLIKAPEPVLQVTLSVYPLGSQAISCTQAIREAAKAVSSSALVGGEAAINLDLQQIVYHDFYHLVYPIAIALMFIVLLAFFESVPMALTALASVAFSAIFGTALAVEAYRLVGVGLPWYLPIVVFTAILGVGMDYNSFMLNRVREEAERADVKEAVATAVSRVGPLVVGLSTIMAGAFSGLVIAFSAPGFRGMGLALAAGVLFAGLMASLLFTPAVIYLLGERAWWPSRPRRSAPATSG